MNNRAEYQIRDIFKKHIENAIEEIAEKDLLTIWWPDGYEYRLSGILAEVIGLMSEAVEMSEEDYSPSPL